MRDTSLTVHHIIHPIPILHVYVCTTHTYMSCVVHRTISVPITSRTLFLLTMTTFSCFLRTQVFVPDLLLRKYNETRFIGFALHGILFCFHAFEHRWTWLKYYTRLIQEMSTEQIFVKNGSSIFS